MTERYKVQELLKQIGKQGQKALLRSKIAIIGCGGLGSVLANNAVRCGIGSIILVDSDRVELTNLHRQILYTEEDIGLYKALAAKRNLERINSDVKIDALIARFDYKNAEKIIKNCNLVFDGTDNFETRYIINEFCVKNRIPWVFASVTATLGYVMSIIPGKTPCYKCLMKSFPLAPPTSRTVGVLNAAVNITASFQFLEGLKILLKKSYSKGLLYIDAWNETIEKLQIKRDPNCQVCSKIFKKAQR